MKMQISYKYRLKSTTNRAYDRMSSIYDLLAGSSEMPLIRMGLEMLAARMGDTILEIGSGTGKALVELSKCTGRSGSVHGIDISSGMLRQAQFRLLKYDSENRVHLLMGDGVRLPYRNVCFTSIFISFTLELFENLEIPQVLEECQRILQPEGRLVVVSLLKSEHPGAIERLYDWFHNRFPVYIDCRPINAPEMVEMAGLRLEKSLTRYMWGLPVILFVATKK